MRKKFSKIYLENLERLSSFRIFSKILGNGIVVTKGVDNITPSFQDPQYKCEY